jgi:polygalacturonase
MKRVAKTVWSIAIGIIVAIAFFTSMGVLASERQPPVASYDAATTIQAQVDAITNAGGTIQLGAGIYTITKPIVITKSNVTIQGEGWATQIVISDSTPEADYGAFDIRDCENIVIRDLSIDGNRAGQGTYTSTPPLILPDDVAGLLVYNVEAHHSMGDGIQPSGCTDVRIDSVYVHDCKEHAVHFNGVDRGWLVNSRLTHDDNSLFSMGHESGRDIFIIGNHFEAKSGSGSYMLQVGATGDPTLNSDVVVVGNTFNINAGLGAIVVSTDFSRLTMRGNIFRDLSTGTNAHHVLIYADASNLDIHDNVFDELADIAYYDPG